MRSRILFAKYQETVLGIIMLFILLLCQALHTNAQGKINPEHPGGDDSIPELKCNILRNMPDSASHFTISMMPCFPMEYGTSYFPMAHIAAAEIRMSADLGKNVALSGTAAMSYANMRDNPNFSTTIFKPWHEISLGATWFFFHTKKESMQHVAYVWLKGNNPGIGTNLLFNGISSIKIGFHGGIGDMNIPVNNTMVDLTGYNISDPSSTRISLSHDPNYTTYKRDNIILPWTYYTNMSLRTVYIGFEIERISDFKADICQKRIKESTRKNSFYADIIFATGVTYDAIILKAPLADPEQTLNVDKYTPKSHYGFKIGWRFENLRTFGGSRSIEAGYLPNAGLYATIKIGIAINPKRPKA